MEATPRTNRSAKGGTRSSLHYGGEGVLIHPPHQGVCGRHGTEDLGVTPGGLSGSSGGTEGSDPISASEAGSGVLGVVGRPNSTRSLVKATRPEAWRQSVSGKAAGEDGWGETESEMSKAGEVDSSLSERPEHHRPRRLADWINPTGARKVHSLIDKVYKRKNLEIAWERVKANQGAGGLTVKASRRLAKGSKSASPDCMRSFAPTSTSPNRCGSSISQRRANQVSGAYWAFRRSMIAYASRHCLTDWSQSLSRYSMMPTSDIGAGDRQRTPCAKSGRKLKQAENGLSTRI